MLKLTKRLRNRSMKCIPVLQLCTSCPRYVARSVALDVEVKVEVDLHDLKTSVQAAVEGIATEWPIDTLFHARLGSA